MATNRRRRQNITDAPQEGFGGERDSSGGKPINPSDNLENIGITQTNFVPEQDNIGEGGLDDRGPKPEGV